MKKLITLFVLFLLLTCRQDEAFIEQERVKASNLMTIKAYDKKSPWQEDEDFIKIVRATFLKYGDADFVYDNYGEIYWDYAITLEKNMAIIPVVKNKEIITLIKVKLKKNQIYFYHHRDASDKLFFNTLVFDKENSLSFLESKREESNISDKNIKSKIGTKYYKWNCSSRTIEVGCVNGRNGCRDMSRTIKSCRFDYESPYPIGDDYDDEEDDFFMIGGGNGGRKGYSPNSGISDDDDEIDDFDPEDCEKVYDKNQEKEYSSKIDELNKDEIFNERQETGFSEDRNGNFIKLERAESTGDTDGLKIHITKETRGYIHTHQNDYKYGVTEEGYTIMKTPRRMFSPSDVIRIMDIAKLRDEGDYDDIYGTMVSSDGIYTIKFTGVKENIKTDFNIEYIDNEYILYMRDESNSMETKFLKFIKEKMNIEGISLFKTIIKKNGDKEVEEIKLNNDDIAIGYEC